MRIKAYAQRFLRFRHIRLDRFNQRITTKLDWKIRRSFGLFSIGKLKTEEIEVFTTRPDTIFGVSFMVLAPEHALVDQITTAEQKETVDSL